MDSAVSVRWPAMGHCLTTKLFSPPTKKPTKSVGFLSFGALSVEILHLRRFFLQRLVLCRLFVPATTQCLVQIDLADQLRQTIGDQRLLALNS